MDSSDQGSPISIAFEHRSFRDSPGAERTDPIHQQKISSEMTQADINLRAARMSDLDDFHELFSHNDVMRYWYDAFSSPIRGRLT